MSLDITLYDEELTTKECICSCCDNVHIRNYHAPLWTGSTTHNLGEMAVFVSLYKCIWWPEGLGIKYAKELIPYLENGLKYLKDNEIQCKQIEPENKWGTYKGFVNFVYIYLKASKKYPNATISICR